MREDSLPGKLGALHTPVHQAGQSTRRTIRATFGGQMGDVRQMKGGAAPSHPNGKGMVAETDELDAFVFLSVFGAMNFIGIGENVGGRRPVEVA